jgi:sulfur-carrier protein
MNEITILFFGELAQIAGSQNKQMSSVKDIESLRHSILSEFPSLKNRTYRIALNKQIVSENSEIKAGDEIAFLPPFAGG